MTAFTYTIKSKSGVIQHGEIDAESADDAAKSIAKPGWFITDVSVGGQTKGFSLRIGKIMSAHERIVFTDHLAEMVSTGTPVIEAIETYKQEENPKTATLMNALIGDIRQGKKISDAMMRHRDVFTPYYVAVVRSGEQTGRLDESFYYIAKELRREYEFIEKIKSAMIYPIMVLAVAMVVIIMLIFLVIPKITDLTKSFGGDMPLATRIVSGVAEFLTSYGGLVVGIMAMIGILLAALWRMENSRKRIEPYLLKAPLIGIIMRQYQLARFLRILGSSLEYGISLAAGCDMVSDIVSVSVYREASLRLKQQVSRGVSIAQALSLENPLYFPSFIVRSLKGAERTGTMAKSLQRIAQFYENDVDRNLTRLTELIQPILTIILGLIVGGIAMAVIAPIYQITSKIR